MPKHLFQPTESSAQLAQPKSAQTESEPSQTKLVDLPSEVLSYLFEFLPLKSIGDLREASKSLKDLIDSKHGPRLKGREFNNYLNLFPNYKENTALTYPDYLKILDEHKEPFLEEQFSEIKIVQINLTHCRNWRHVSDELKEKILKIKEKNINYTEAKRREDLLNAINLEIIWPKIKSKLQSQLYLQSNLQILNLNHLKLTRLPKALFTNNALQAFWQQLTGLSLGNNELATLPAEIGELRALRKLSLNNNQFKILPTEIGGLQALDFLSLNNNKLTSLPPEIGGLRVLTDLSLGNNRLTSLPPEIGGLHALTSLYLDNNQLTSLPPEIGGLRMLTDLCLENNQLTSLPPEISGLRMLTDLSLSKNKLTSLPPEIGNLQTLIEISIHNNKLTSLPVEISELKALRRLYLHDNQLTILPAEIGELQELRILYLHDNQLTKLPTEIGRLRVLIELSLSNNKLTILPDEICELQELTRLFLHDNQLTSLPSKISELQALRWSSFGNNQLPSETLEQFELRFGANFVKDTLVTQTYPNIPQSEDLSKRKSPRP